MFCPQCGARNDDQSAYCFMCGQLLHEDTAPAPASSAGTDRDDAGNPYLPPQNTQEDTPATIPNYMPQAIILTVLSGLMICCNCISLLGLPFGIVAIVYANSVNTHLASGDIPMAWQASRNAKTWCWISFGIFLLSLVAGAVLLGLGIMGSILQNHS